MKRESEKAMFAKRFVRDKRKFPPFVKPNPPKDAKYHMAIPIHQHGGELYAESDRERDEHKVKEDYNINGTKYQTNMTPSNPVGHYYITKEDMKKHYPNASRFSEKMNNDVIEKHIDIIRKARHQSHNGFKSINVDESGRET